MNLLILLKINEFDNLELSINRNDYLNLINVYNKSDSDLIEGDLTLIENGLYVLKNRCVFNVLRSRNEGGEENVKLLNDF